MRERVLNSRFTVEKIERSSSDTAYLALLILLIGVGFAMMFSASYYYAEKVSGDPTYFLKKHIVHLIIGGALAFIITRTPMAAIRRLIPLILVVAFVLMGLTFVPGVGSQVLGARRWIILFGMSFQPSELVKLAVILYLAHIFSKKEDRIDDLLNTVLPPLVLVGIFVMLTYLQNDYSTSVFILLIALSMFFVVGIRVMYFVFLGSAAIPLSIILLLTKEHRVQRIISFLDPKVDPAGAGYQVMAARNALVNGGLWGRGIGKGVMKLGGLPEAHSDFVFAVVGEELGLIGVVFVLALFVGLTVRGYMIAIGSKDRFSYYVAFGITTCIVVQVLFNIAVVCGLVPATGIPLPFFSAGGSSVMVTLVMCGILLSISRESGTNEEVSA